MADAHRAEGPSALDGHVDPDDQTPWAMQVAVRYDKHDLPDEDLVCATVARAVVTLLDDPRAREGAWHDRVQRWRDGRIRKLVRRARGVRWDRAQAVEGVTVVDGSAAARAYVPMPTRPLPPELDALQVSGTTFPPKAPQEAAAADVAQDGAAGVAERDPEGVVPRVVVVALSPYATMTSGKAAAQSAHGAQLAYEALREVPGGAEVLDRWRRDGWRVEVDRPDRARWEGLDAPVQVVDAGFTELDGPTETVRAWWRRPS